MNIVHPVVRDSDAPRTLGKPYKWTTAVPARYEYRHTTRTGQESGGRAHLSNRPGSRTSSLSDEDHMVQWEYPMICIPLCWTSSSSHRNLSLKHDSCRVVQRAPKPPMKTSEPQIPTAGRSVTGEPAPEYSCAIEVLPVGVVMASMCLLGQWHSWRFGTEYVRLVRLGLETGMDDGRFLLVETSGACGNY